MNVDLTLGTCPFNICFTMITLRSHVLGSEGKGKEKGMGRKLKKKKRISAKVLVSFEVISQHGNQERRNKLSYILKFNFCRSNRDLKAQRRFL